MRKRERKRERANNLPNMHVKWLPEQTRDVEGNVRKAILSFVILIIRTRKYRKI